MMAMVVFQECKGYIRSILLILSKKFNGNIHKDMVN